MNPCPALWSGGGGGGLALRGWQRRRIRLIEGNAKTLSSKSNLGKYFYFAADVYLYEAPSPPKFLS